MNAAAQSTENLQDLYRELVLDHAKTPRHFHKLEPCTHSAQGLNPLCGDKLHLYLQIEDGRVHDASFEGSGCAISVASASLMTDTIIGLDVAGARALALLLQARLSGAESDGDTELGKLAALEGVREYPSRVKCATLAWHALTHALDSEQNTATTE